MEDAWMIVLVVVLIFLACCGVVFWGQVFEVNHNQYRLYSGGKPTMTLSVTQRDDASPSSIKVTMDGVTTEYRYARVDGKRLYIKAGEYKN
jgi:cell division protein YceG involved in septum cleavage